jgi:hypothetical protein
LGSSALKNTPPTPNTLAMPSSLPLHAGVAGDI